MNIKKRHSKHQSNAQQKVNLKRSQRPQLAKVEPPITN